MEQAGQAGSQTALRLAAGAVPAPIVLRRQVKADLAVVDPRDPEQLRLSFATLTEDTLVYEYAVLVTSLTGEILTMPSSTGPRHAKNPFDELKNHWGWGSFTTQDIKRCRFMAPSPH